MGKADDDTDSNSIKAIDASVGALVWVRRRNGSWWPGRIMSLDEVPEDSLISPRLGTPVKLLGRDDASVDWYNLEKSKRVKPFRCGEYDDCIEKAKASAANGNKKTVKYARREDAILHALEIENTRLSEVQVNIFSGANNSAVDNGITDKELSINTMSVSGEDEDLTEGSGSKGIMHTGSGLDSDSESDDSAPELSQSGLSFEEPALSGGASKGHSVQVKRRRTPNDSEDDGLVRTRRMKGLEDLGMSIGDSSAGNTLSNGSLMNGCRGNNLSRRKRSQVATFPEFSKKKNRRRPLTKVLESTAMVSIPVTCDQLPGSSDSHLQGPSDSKISEKESGVSTKSPSKVINTNSGSNGVACENDASLNPSELTHDDSDMNNVVNKEENTCSVLGLAENISSDRLFDVPFVGEENRSTGHSPRCSVSPLSELPETGANLRRQSSPVSQSEDLYQKNEVLNEFDSTSSAAIHAEDINQRIDRGSSRWQLKGKRNSRNASKNRKQDLRRYEALDGGTNDYLADVECLGGSPQSSEQKVASDGNIKSLSLQHCILLDTSNPFCENQVDGAGERTKSTSQKDIANRGVTSPPQRLLPCRQSRFTVNPKYQTFDISGRNFYASNSRLFDIKLDVNSNHRPRQPAVSLTSKLNGKAIIGHPLTVELLEDVFPDGFNGSNDCHIELEASDGSRAALRKPGGRCSTSQGMQHHHSPTSSKSRKNGAQSKKTRRLSSLTGNKGACSKLTTKVKGPVTPVVACIPLKLVFSRINEDLNGMSRQTNHATKHQAAHESVSTLSLCQLHPHT